MRFTIRPRPLDLLVASLLLVAVAPLVLRQAAAVWHLAELNAPWLIDLAHRLPEFVDPRLLPSIAIAVVALVLAGVGFALLHRYGLAPQEEPLPLPDLGVAEASVEPAQTSRWLGPAAVAGSALLPAAAACVLVAKLIREPADPGVLLWWGFFLVTALLPAWLADRRHGRLPRLPLSWRELLVVLLLVAGHAALVGWDVGSWKYTCIGDEWATYLRARDMAELPLNSIDPTSVFGDVTHGVDMDQTPIETTIQSRFMRVIGYDNIGWRSASVLMFSFGLVPLLIIARMLLDRTSAAVAVGLAAFSHYLFADAHMGYGMSLWRLSILMAVAATLMTARSASLTGAVITGACLALCRLVLAAPAIAPMVLLPALVALLSDRPRWGVGWILSRPSRRRAVALIGVALAVFLVASVVPQSFYPPLMETPSGIGGLLWKTSFAPLLNHLLGPDWSDRTFDRVWTFGQFLDQSGKNVLRSLLAPLVLKGSSHYVAGFALDGMTTALVIIGMVATVVLARNRRGPRMLWWLYLAWLGVIGLLSPYEYMPISRYHVLVPLWALFAGFGFRAVVRAAARAEHPASRRTTIVAAWSVIAVVAVLNLHTFYRTMPRTQDKHPAVIAMRELQQLPEPGRVWACFGNWHPLDLLVHAYPVESRLLFLPADRFLVDLPWQEIRAEDVLLVADPDREVPRHLMERLVDQFPGTFVDRIQRGNGQVYRCRLPYNMAGRPPRASRRGQIQVGAEIERVPLSDLVYVSTPPDPTLEVDVAPDGETIRVDGEGRPGSFVGGIRTEFHLVVPEGFDVLDAALALADSPALQGPGWARFSVLVDGGQVYTREVSSESDPVPIRVDLGAGEVVTLRTEHLEGEPEDSVWPVWMDPGFLR